MPAAGFEPALPPRESDPPRGSQGPQGAYRDLWFTLVPVETSCGVWFVHRPFHAGRDLDGAGPGVTCVGYHDAPGDDVCMMNHIDSI